MSPIIRFYQNENINECSHKLSTILSASNKWLEFTHDYIQWMFPLDEKSRCNINAPVLADSDIYEFNSNRLIRINFNSSIYKFIDFLGLRYNPNDQTFAISNVNQIYTWYGINHNSMRITRFIASMSMFGFSDIANDVFSFMKTYNEDHHSINYWEDALQGQNRSFR